MSGIGAFAMDPFAMDHGSGFDQVHHFTHGAFTPAIGYTIMVLAAATGLRCTLRARSRDGAPRRGWLLLGATSLAAGIWTLHFVAMLGFSVPGSVVRYNVPLTLLSLVVAFAVVGAGVLIVAYGRSRGRALAIGGLVSGLGVAAMHYSGMAAVRINGTLDYRLDLVAASLAIAIVAATAALWLAFNVGGMVGTLGSALVMGIAVSSMHYTGMAAVRADLASRAGEVVGATEDEFLTPLSIGVGIVLLIVFVIIAVSPIDTSHLDGLTDAADPAPQAWQPWAAFTGPAEATAEGTVDADEPQPVAGRVDI